MREKTQKILKSAGLAFLTILILGSIITLYSAPIEKREEIPLSQLVTEINNGEVKRIDVKGNTLNVELNDGTKQVTQKEAEASLTESLANYNTNQDELKKIIIEIKDISGIQFWVGTILPFLLPFLLIGVFVYLMMRSAKNINKGALSFGQSKAEEYRPKDKKKTTFRDVAGVEEAKEELKEVVDFLMHPRKYLKLGAKIPRGVLLVGPPGTGKTLIARAVAGEANVPYFHISGSEFVEMFVGVGASRVRSLFNKAKKNAPCIIFLDELDAVGRHRGAGLGGGHDEREQTLNQILVEMDGFERETGIVVLAATNRPDILDPALLRPGRFDRRVVLDMPDIKDRVKILKIHTKDIPLSKDVSLRQIAERTPGFSGADLANLTNEAAILAGRLNKKEIGMKEFLSSIEKVLLGPERKSHVFSKREKKIAAYHEAGHAVAAHLLPHTDPVRKVSIVARGEAGGYTLKLPEEDKHLRTKQEFLSEIAVLLAGYAAEKQIFKDVTTGAANDLKGATQLARKLVTEYGMSEKLGPLTFGVKEELVFLGKELHEQRNYSDETAFQIDKEIDKIVKGALKRVSTLLKNNKKALQDVAKNLIKKETLEQKEFRKIMAKYKK